MKVEWILEWDSDNESKFAKHGIYPWEVEEVIVSDSVWAKNKRGYSGDRMVVGSTIGGRCLTVIVQMREEVRTIRPITGWLSTRGERTKFGR